MERVTFACTAIGFRSARGRRRYPWWRACGIILGKDRRKLRLEVVGDLHRNRIPTFRNFLSRRIALHLPCRSPPHSFSSPKALWTRSGEQIVTSRSFSFFLFPMHKTLSVTSECNGSYLVVGKEDRSYPPLYLNEFRIKLEIVYNVPLTDAN